MCRVGASREVRNGSEKSRGGISVTTTQRRVDNWIELSLASLQKKTHTVCVKSKLRLTRGTHSNLTCTWPSTHACVNQWTQSSLAFIQGTILCLLDSKCELKSGGLTCESGASHEANLSLQRKCSFRVLQLQSKFQLIFLLDWKKMAQQICKAQLKIKIEVTFADPLLVVVGSLKQIAVPRSNIYVIYAWETLFYVCLMEESFYLQEQDNLGRHWP